MGGGAMRAAAKVAGIKVGNGGVHCIKSDQYPSFFVTRQAASSLSPSEEWKLLVSQPQGAAKTSEIDDWVFTGGEEAAYSNGGVKARVVFYGTPTFPEAQEALLNLRWRLRRLICRHTVRVGLDVALDDQSIIDKSCFINEFGIAPAVPSNAIKAFRLLNESRAAQNVVASIASDPNVWASLSKNQVVQDFLHSQRTCFENTNKNRQTEENSDADSEIGETKPVIALSDIVQKVKIKVVHMMNNLSDYFQNFFGGQAVDELFPSSDRHTSAEAAMVTSFMGLAVMAIMVIVVRRDQP